MEKILQINSIQNHLYANSNENIINNLINRLGIIFVDDMQKSVKKKSILLEEKESPIHHTNVIKI